MMKVKSKLVRLDKEIQKHKRILYDLQLQVKEVIEEVVDQCNHPEPMEYSDYWGKPWIFCRDCGLAEEGWGCGHDVFRSVQYTDLPRVTEKYAERHIRLKRNQDEQFARRHPKLYYQTDLEGNKLHPRDWIRIPEPFHDSWNERKHLKRERI